MEHLSQLCSSPFGFISVFKSRNNYCGQESGKAETQEQKSERESSPLWYQNQQNVPSFVGFSPLASRDLCGDAIWCFLMSRFWMSVSVFFSRSPFLQSGTPSPTPIVNLPHVVAPLCKRKSPWISECVSCCFSQSLVHCGKLINQAEVLQKDLSKSDCSDPCGSFSL